MTFFRFLHLVLKKNRYRRINQQTTTFLSPLKSTIMIDGYRAFVNQPSTDFNKFQTQRSRSVFLNTIFHKLKFQIL